jgi:NADH-quinone oxidoreductase subunit E
MPVDQVEKILDRFPGARRDKLIPILQEIQNSYGYLTEDSIKRVGTHLKLPTSKIYGIATFYNQFSFIPRGKFHIRICHGSSCHVNGSAKLIRELEKILQLKNGDTTKDGIFSLEVVACLGACSRSPVVEVNDEFCTYTDLAGLRKIIESFRSNKAERA